MAPTLAVLSQLITCQAGMDDRRIRKPSAHGFFLGPKAIVATCIACSMKLILLGQKSEVTLPLLGSSMEDEQTTPQRAHLSFSKFTRSELNCMTIMVVDFSPTC